MDFNSRNRPLKIFADCKDVETWVSGTATFLFFIFKKGTKSLQG